MAPPSLTYEQVMKVRQQLFDDALATGKFTPLLWPWDTLVMVSLFVGIYFTPNLPRRWARVVGYCSYTAVVVQSLYIFGHRRSLGAASGYGWGLALSWGWIMSMSLMLIHNVDHDFVRLEWRELEDTRSSEQTAVLQSSGVTQSDKEYGEANNVRERNPGRKSNSTIKASSSLEQTAVHADNDKPGYQLIWQGMPTSYYHRADWVIDLMTSFRGPNWNYRIPTLPKMGVQSLRSSSSVLSLAKEEAVDFSSAWETVSSSRPVLEARYKTQQNHDFRVKCVIKTAAAYVLIDIIKAIMITDPYFLGLLPLDSPAPWQIIPRISALTGIPAGPIIRLFRLLLSMTGVISALFLIFSLSPLFFYVILPKLITDPRRISYSPLTDVRMYPGFLEFPFPVIADKGLAGFWGRCWHQMFRFGVSEPSRILLQKLGITPRTQLARAIQLFIAFGLTGFLHFAGSYTCFSIVPSKPWDAMFFFLLQAVGITLQTFLALGFRSLAKRPGLGFLVSSSPSTSSTPKHKHTTGSKKTGGKMVPRIANTIFVILWLYLTGPLLADDFSRCGIWLFEPVPISFVRGLQGHGWLQWYGHMAGWYDGTQFVTAALPVASRNAPWDKGFAIF